MDERYSAIVKKLDVQRLTVDINEEINIERLQTMYYDYDGDREIELRFIDPRRFTAEQRRFAYALLGDIYAYTGEPIESLKEVFKLRYEALTGLKISLANHSSNTVSEVGLYTDIILDFIFENHIPFKNGYEILPVNQEYYFYKCITTRTCCICGKPNAEIDHFDKALGRRSRKKVDHSEYTFASLCRIHHQEKHQLGVTSFKNKYKVKGIKLNQETIKKLRIGG